jgi:hypothetical protein
MTDGEVESALDFNCGGCKYFKSGADCAHGETVKDCGFMHDSYGISNWARKIPEWCPLKNTIQLYCPRCDCNTRHGPISMVVKGVYKCVVCRHVLVKLEDEENYI